MLRPIVFLLLLHYKVLGVISDDMPCAARQMEFGPVCVCNSTYCDTVTRPPPLAIGSYYYYTTNQDSPGFTRTTGNFTVEDRVYDDDHVVFTVNPSIEHQEILGFGGSFTDSSGIVISNMSTEVQDKIMESYFGAKGVEYTFGRVPIGGSDFSPRVYTYDDTPFDGDLKHFSLAGEDYKYKIPLIQKAMNISPHDIKLIGCAWSSPSWMKTNGASSSGYLLSKYYSSWAKYHMKFLDGYATEGIKFWMITSGNEIFFPLIIQGSLGTNMITMPITHRQWVKDHMAPLLLTTSSNHSNVKFGLMDDMRPFINFWMSRFARYPDTYDLVAGVTLHWYWDWISPSFVLDDYHKNFPDKLIIYSEASVNVILFGGQPVELGSWRRGALYAFNMMQNINHWANAYIDWNLVLNTDGGPYLGLPLDAAIIVNKTSGEFYKNPMFYTLGHFSKFIPPGSRRIDVQSNQNSSTNATQTGHSFDLKNVLGLLRPSSEASDNSSTPSPLPTFPPLPYIQVPQTVLCLATNNPDNSSTVIVFNAKDVAVNVTIVDVMAGNITITMAPQSINTFVYWRNPS